MTVAASDFPAAPAPENPAAGLLFTLEGLDGCGKTTQARLLARRLEAEGFAVELLREPGGTALGETLRGLLLGTSGAVPCSRAELLLFCAARAQLLEERILPALKAGRIVVLDRFIDATFAYQGGGRGLPSGFLEQVEAFLLQGLLPHRTFFLDLPVEECLERQRRRGEAQDRLEAEGSSFRQRVRAGYLQRVEQAQERFAVLDACRPIEALSEEIWQGVREVLGLRPLGVLSL